MTIDPADHVRLAVSIARRYGRDVPDEAAVLEEAWLSLLRAARRFDPQKGAWAAFASASIVLSVRGEVARQLAAPRTVSLFVTGEDGQEVERKGLPHVEPVDGTRLFAAELRAAVGRLPPKEARVVTLHFGLEDDQARTLEEIAAELGLSRGRVWQLKRRALGRLRRRVRR